MRVSPILSAYVGRRFLLNFALIFVVLLSIIFLFDAVELLRRAAVRGNVSFADVVTMGLLKLPYLGQEMFPFAVLFGAMAAFWRLTRNHELVVTRAAGVSAWQILAPALLIALGLGLFQIMAFNPLASAMLSRFDRMDATLMKGRSNLLSLSRTGLWLRQAGDDGQSVVHAQNFHIDEAEVHLIDVTIFSYDNADHFTGRIVAETGVLKVGFWLLRQVRSYGLDDPNGTPSDEARIDTDITLDNIQDSFASPETLSFWALPGFIRNLDRVGFSATRHRLYWHSLLAAPLLLCGMVLIAATFTLRQSRSGGTTLVVFGGILTGLVLYFFSDVVFALGLRDSIPVTLAAWTPAGVCILLGLAMVFHLEDG
jgi:lipopolysaccharide export system permease protein